VVWEQLSFGRRCNLLLRVDDCTAPCAMGAFDPVITYEKGTYIGQSLFPRTDSFFLSLLADSERKKLIQAVGSFVCSCAARQLIQHAQTRSPAKLSSQEPPPSSSAASPSFTQVSHATQHASPFHGSELICGPGAILRGDLRRSTAGQHVVISMGRYCSVGEGAIIRPPGKIYKGFISLLNLWMLY